ncbi:MAG: alpha/beta hydrolase [Proteobacteria bacterium]|nr:alpha/beta hydrolase [Pseudomonadota bacterium]
MQLPTAEQWAERCRVDGEFMLAARYWQGGIRLTVGDRQLAVSVNEGQPTASSLPATGVIGLSGSESVWEKVLAAVPSRFNNDAMANMMQGQGLALQSDRVVFAQYYAAATRAIELLRPRIDAGDILAHDTRDEGVFDAPAGRYVHLNLIGQTHRVYFEEAGEGIPVLLQHTAGCHGSQWRHLFEMPEITSRFRLIAYDLPFHGKSLPPVGQPWWTEQYLLKGEFLRSVPRAMSRVLGLDRPVFVGCSVGGLLALDLAHKHPGEFRAVVALEGALEIPGKMEDSQEFWHPQVSNEYKARLMEALISPTSPVHYRKETSFIYAAGWPQVFLGDLYYYMNELDLRQLAPEIDASRIGIHILSGEYDCSGTVELGQAAHQAIPGSTWQEMKGVGHFPMSENPEVFKSYLLPVLDQIASTSG